MFLTTLGVITPTVSHLLFQLSVIERMISGTLSNLLEFPSNFSVFYVVPPYAYL